METKQYFISLRMISRDIDLTIAQTLSMFGATKINPNAVLQNRYGTMLEKLTEGYIRALFNHQEPTEFYRWLFRILGAMGIDYDGQYIEDSDVPVGKFIADEMLSSIDNKVLPKLKAIWIDTNNPYLRWVVNINGDSVQLILTGDKRIEEYEDLKKELEFYKHCYEIVSTKTPSLLPEYSDIEQLDYCNLVQQTAIKEPAWLTSLITKSTK